MDEIKIFEDLYLFRSGGGNIPITFNQYLLLGKEPLLVHTGNSQQVVELIPRLKKILGDKSLSYIFISHFEGDECGGLSIIMEHFPKAVSICSEITARQLVGFGFTNEIIIKSPEDTLETEDYNLKFISYPSEMHLWQGLLALETQRNILFSSDLFIRFDRINDTIIDSNIKNEINGITDQQIPSPTACKTLQQTLLELSIKDIAPGHGPFLRG